MSLVDQTERIVFMLTTAENMLGRSDFCVLATCSRDLPNSSLMHFLYDTSDKTIYMLTLRGSVKDDNITANPQVSLLVDTRMDVQQQGQPVAALTVYGKARFVEGAEARRAKITELLDKYPDLAPIAGNDQCLVMQVQVEKMMLLDGVNDQSTIYL